MVAATVCRGRRIPQNPNYAQILQDTVNTCRDRMISALFEIFVVSCQLAREGRAMSQSPNPAAPQQVAPLLALGHSVAHGRAASRCDRAVARCSAAAAVQSHHPARSRPRLPRGRPRNGCHRGIPAGHRQQPALHRCIFPPGNRPGEAGRHRRGNRCVRPRH